MGAIPGQLLKPLGKPLESVAFFLLGNWKCPKFFLRGSQVEEEIREPQLVCFPFSKNFHFDGIFLFSGDCERESL